MINNIVFYFAISLFFLGILLYILGSMLQNSRFKELIVNTWEYSEKNLVANRSINVADEIFTSIYKEKGKLSWLKLITIVVILNLFVIFSFLLSDHSVLVAVGSELFKNDKELYSFLYVIIGFIFFTSFFSELFSYYLTNRFIKRAVKKKSYIPLVIDFFLMLILYFVIPILYLASEIQLIYVQLGQVVNVTLGLITPLYQISAFLFLHELFQDSGNSYYYIIIFSIFSVCFPTVTLMLGIMLANSKKLLYSLSRLIERIDSLSSLKTKEYGLALCGISSGVITIISYNP